MSEKSTLAEIQLAIDAAQRKRRELANAQPEERNFAMIIATLLKAAEAYRRQIELGLDEQSQRSEQGMRDAARSLADYSDVRGAERQPVV